MFLLYIDITHTIEGNVRIGLFADDTQIWNSISSDGIKCRYDANNLKWEIFNSGA